MRFKGRTIIEMNSGPGFLAERIMAQVEPAKYFALEPRDRFLNELSHRDSIHIPQDGYDWSTYDTIEQDLSDLHHTRTEINPNLVFIATPEPAQQEQLINQWLGAIGTGSWIQKYGRVCMYIFVTQNLRQKIMASTASPLRSRLTVLREGNCEVREILHTPFVREDNVDRTKVQWIEDFTDLPVNPTAVRGTPDIFFPVASLSLLEFKPFEHSAITAPLATYDFIAKTLLSNKSTPLNQQIRGIASGAYAILEKLSPEVRQKWPQDMTVHEINSIAVAFDQWPFKPKFIHNESFDDIRGAKELRGIIRAQIKSFKPLVQASDFTLKNRD